MKHFYAPIYIVSILLFCFPPIIIEGQQKQYSVEPTPFSSIGNNEFAPMWYNDGLVYCSSFKEKSFFSFLKKKTYTLFFTNLADLSKAKNSELFSYELISRMNDGPITFNNDLSVAYFNRNHKMSSIFKNFPDSINPLGIFSAKYIDGKWKNIEPFPYNNPHYSLLTPMLSPDNNRLYFASDMPGGYGGADLYYSDWDGEKWLEPVNMGSTINTAGNESYPYMTKDGKLFFSSDGHPGLGGKDIFFSYLEDGSWIKPIHLRDNINSPFDDFGLILNDDLTEGYFTSNRTDYDNIYKLEKNAVVFEECENQVETKYCYTFADDYIFNEGDTTIKYIWEFEDGIIKEGPQVYHCFSKLGNHKIDLTIEDKFLKDSILFSHTFDLKIDKIEQPYIDSPIFVETNKEVTFKANKNNLPNITATNYFWNFGNGFIEEKEMANHKFSKPGNYNIKLGVSGFNKRNNNFENKCITKEIIVYDNIFDILQNHSSELEEIANQLDAENHQTNKVTNDDIYVYMLNSLSQEKKILIYNKLSPYFYNYKKLKITDLLNSDILKEAINIVAENEDIELKLLLNKNNNLTQFKNLIIQEFNKKDQKLNFSISEIEKSNKNYILGLVFK